MTEHNAEPTDEPDSSSDQDVDSDVDVDADNERTDEPDASSEQGFEYDVPAEWMAPVDDDILELMQSDEIMMPDQISDEGICRGTDAAYRCRELAKRGLLTKYMPGMYDITDLGEQYLEGEVDPTELEVDE